MEKNFNFVIGHYWPKTEQIGTYTYFGDVHYGSVEDANDFLKYAKEKEPDRDWQIFKVVPV
jgi:hypothetical protein